MLAGRILTVDVQNFNYSLSKEDAEKLLDGRKFMRKVLSMHQCMPGSLVRVSTGLFILRGNKKKQQIFDMFEI